ncbi:hypothetical protein CBJ32_19240 [Salmonella enterica subsp. enterica serovar Give]|nr:hypothetical protein [Salmonella enterica subsp. enterica serovar Give]
MRGPVFEFMLDDGDEIRQGLKDNKIEYMGIAALSFSVTDMVELIHAVNTPETWSGVAVIARSWIKRHQNSSVEIAYNENGTPKSIKLTGYNYKELEKMGATELIRASFKKE